MVRRGGGKSEIREIREKKGREGEGLDYGVSTERSIGKEKPNPDYREI